MNSGFLPSISLHSVWHGADDEWIVCLSLPAVSLVAFEIFLAFYFVIRKAALLIGFSSSVQSPAPHLHTFLSPLQSGVPILPQDRSSQEPSAPCWVPDAFHVPAMSLLLQLTLGFLSSSRNFLSSFFRLFSLSTFSLCLKLSSCFSQSPSSLPLPLHTLNLQGSLGFQPGLLSPLSQFTSPGQTHCPPGFYITSPWWFSRLPLPRSPVPAQPSSAPSGRMWSKAQPLPSPCGPYIRQHLHHLPGCSGKNARATLTSPCAPLPPSLFRSCQLHLSNAPSSLQPHGHCLSWS